MTVLFLKTHVSGYTRADGTVVAPHEDNRKLRVVDVHGNGKRIDHYDDKKGLMYSAQQFPSGTKWTVFESFPESEGGDQVLGEMFQHASLDDAKRSVRGLRISASAKAKQAKYSSIPSTWSGEAKKLVRALIDAGVSIDRFASSSQSKSKYIYLDSGDKIRLSDHDLPKTYESADFDFRYGGDVAALVKQVAEKTSASAMTKAHPVQQAMSAAAAPADLNEAGFRRNPGEPDAAQAEDGEYRKPRVQWRGLTIAIENPAGSVRRGRNRHGVSWEIRMRYDYGEVVGSMGVDGDPVDIYLGPHLEDAPMVYVVHQRRVNDWDAYDEDKAMAGFLTETDAAQAFLSNYNDPRFLGPITAMPVDEFVAKVRATREKPAMIKALLFFKGYVGPYLRGGRIVNIAGYHGRSARATASPGQLSLFGSNEPLPPSPLKGKDPVASTPDLFDEPTHTEPTRELIAEHERLVDVLNSPSHADDKAEAKKQAAELAEIKGEAGEHKKLLIVNPRTSQENNSQIKKDGGNSNLSNNSPVEAKQESKMEGSEKQVAWATKIRDEAVEQWSVLSKKLSDAGYSDAAKAAEDIAKKIGDQTKSRWLIDNKDYLGYFQPTHPSQMANMRNDWGFILSRIRGASSVSGPVKPSQFSGLGLKPEVDRVRVALMELYDV